MVYVTISAEIKYNVQHLDKVRLTWTELSDELSATQRGPILAYNKEQAHEQGLVKKEATAEQHTTYVLS